MYSNIVIKINITYKNISMFSIRLPDNLENQLEVHAKNLHIAKSKLAIEALSKYFEYFEDLDDYNNASKILLQNNKTYTHEEVKHELNL